jgi:hypothetical protein
VVVSIDNPHGFAPRLLKKFHRGLQLSETRELPQEILNQQISAASIGGELDNFETGGKRRLPDFSRK